MDKDEKTEKEDEQRGLTAVDNDEAAEMTWRNDQRLLTSSSSLFSSTLMFTISIINSTTTRRGNNQEDNFDYQGVPLWENKMRDLEQEKEPFRFRNFHLETFLVMTECG